MMLQIEAQGQRRTQFVHGEALGGVMPAGENMAAEFTGFVPGLFAGLAGDKGIEADGGGFGEEGLATAADHADAAYLIRTAGAVDDGMIESLPAALGQVDRLERIRVGPQADGGAGTGGEARRVIEREA